MDASGRLAEQILDDVAFGGVSDPFPLYNQARELDGGVHWVERMGAWMVLRYDDVSAIARDAENFSSNAFWGFSPSWHDSENPEHRRFVDIQSRILFFNDPPIHSALRKIVRQGFLPGAIGAWRPVVETEVDELLSRFEKGDEVETIEGFVGEVPVAIIARILGVPVESRRDFRNWSFSVASTFDPLCTGDRRNRCIEDGLRLIALFEDLIERRRRKPEDGLVNMVLDAAEQSEVELAPADLLAQLVVLLVAGNETTSNFIANAMSLLVDNPEERAAICADRALLKPFLEEVLRFDPPLQVVGRRAVRDWPLGQRQIKAGDIILCGLAAANRDPRRFDRPDAFNSSRSPNLHIAFNQGIHSCVGAPLARLEAEITIHRLLEKFPDFSRGTEPRVRRVGNLTSRGWESLPIRF